MTSKQITDQLTSEIIRKKLLDEGCPADRLDEAENDFWTLLDANLGFTLQSIRKDAIRYLDYNRGELLEVGWIIETQDSENNNKMAMWMVDENNGARAIVSNLTTGRKMDISSRSTVRIISK